MSLTHRRRRRRPTFIAILAMVGAGLIGYVAQSGPATAAGTTTVPRPDHVVIVVEENHSKLNIIGSPDAPYINSLATDNANFVNSYAETHPSQPNYIAMFSGATQGVTDDTCPQTFSGENLGHQLLAANLGFVGYSETQPSVGYTGCTSGKYARKHNPWSDFSNVPGSASQPFTAFPTDFSTLPEVSYVIPNLDDDMHDGSVAQGDAWLQTKMSGYISWAKTHNSLFILTFDEDDYGSNNQIPTIMVGGRVAPGTYTETINHYSVLRTIQDAYGLAPIGGSISASPILDVWTPPAGNQAPTAALTSSCTQLNCGFDGRASSDPDGTIQAYNWTFGDGSTGSGAQPTHAYAAAGTYSVTLTVSDNGGATGSTTKSVTVTAPAGTPFVSDQFARTVNNGLGSADVGGAWQLTGNTSLFSVSPGAARLKLSAGSTLAGYLAPTSSDTDFVFNASIDKVPTGGTLYLTSTGRRASTNNEYRLRIQLTTGATVAAFLSRVVGGTETVLTPTVTIPNITYTPGLVLSVRFQVVGTNPTTLRSKIWPISSTEPSAWQSTATDSTAVLQAAGSVGVTGYLSGAATNAPVTLSLSALTARPSVVAPPVNQPPMAAFTSSCTQLACSFDGSTSSDAEGPIASYAWAYGDSTSGTGATSSHSYGAANTFSVVLTVTDAGGLSSSVTHTVTTTTPPPVNQPPMAAFTSSCTQLACSFDGSTSSDAEGPIASYAWAYGDSTSGTGATSSHSYGAANTFSVVLTVTDAGGLSSSVTHTVTTTTPPPVNQPPTAAFTSSCTQLACSFDGSTSSDPEGPIASYAWAYGDSTSGTGATSSHSYGAANTFSVVLTVTDAGGLSSSVTHTVTTTTPPPVNQPPTAAFTSSCTQLACSFDGSTSSDPEGPIASYAWAYGDSTSGTGATSSHSYGTANTFSVVLTVTDAGGLTASVTHTVTTTTPPPVNQPPTAAFTSSCTQLACSFDGSTSSDPEGPIASYAWSYGDSTSGTGATSSHSYGTANTFSVVLTVTDAGGLTSSVTHTVTTTNPPPVNQPPVAAFTSSCTQLACSFDGSTSSDAEGPIASYAWAYGDSTSGTGATSSHSYGTANTFSVVLTVTDAGGLTSSVTHTVTTTTPPPTTLASDLFNRTVNNGFGTADVGGAWTVVQGAAANFWVSGGTASMRMPTPGTTLAASLPAVSSSKTDFAVTVTADKAMTSNGVYLSLGGRRVGSNNEYRSDVRLTGTGAVNLHLAKLVGGTETALSTEFAVPGLTFTAGTKLRIRIQVTGANPTTIRTRVWAATAAEPTTWSATVTDTTAVLQAPGAVAITTYLSGGATNAPIVVGLSNLTATALP